MSNMKHLFKQMVFLTLLLTFPLLEIHAQITIDMKNKPASEVVKQIEKVSKYRFFYKKGLPGMNTPITVEANDQSIDAVMGQVVKQIPVSYTVKGGTQVVIAESELQNGTASKSKTVKGVITDMNGEPVIGANIVQKGSTNGVISDLNGAFEINVSEGAVLQVSYIGYLSQEVKVGKGSLMNITLKEDTQTLDEVVVIGYTTQKKGLLTGSVVSLNVDESMEKMPTTSAANILVGRLAGVNVSTSDGVPGSNPSLSIRTGSSWNDQNVLYVIDGIVRGSGDFNNLSPNEIENVTVLKDAASAAIYGARSEGGVVLVTTKRGKVSKPVFNYSYSYGVDTRTSNVEQTSAVQTGEIFNRVHAGENVDWFWSQEELDYIKTINDGWGYDQLDIVWRDPTTQTHNLSVNGGSEKVKYFGGVSYVKQKGFLKSLNYDKFNFRLNTTVDVTDNLQFFASMALSNNKKQNATYEGSGMYSKLLRWQPDQPIYTDGGQLIDYSWTGSVGGEFDGFGGYSYNYLLKPQINLNVTYKIPGVEGLSVKAAYGSNWQNDRNEDFRTRYQLAIMKTSGQYNHIFHTDDASILRYRTSSQISKDYIEKKSSWGYDYQLNFQANYNRTFKDVHHVSAALVYERSESSGGSLKAGRETFPVYLTDQFWAASSARADTWGEGDATWKNGRASFIGQFNYSYANKYLFNFSFREDGSMNFAKDERWGFFPSGSAGWIISEESFFNKKSVNYLKLRLSAGLTGNDSVGGWAWQDTYQSGNSAFFGKDPSKWVGIKYGSLVNTALTWEKSFSYNVGIDMNFLNRWNTSVDYWFRNTYDILGDRQASTPTSFSRSMPKENYGEIHAQGFDFTLGYNNKWGDFDFHGNLTMSYGWNKVIVKDHAENAKWIDIEQGKPRGYIKGYRFDQIIKTQEQLDQFVAEHPNYNLGGKKPVLGAMIYKDLSGPEGVPDGIIDSWDKDILTKYNFPINYGLNLGGSWKGISLDVMFNGKLKWQKSFKNLAEGVDHNRMWVEWYDNSWTPENTSAWLPQRVSKDKTYTEDSDFWYKDASFIRLKYINLGYTIPKTVYKGIVDRVKVYFSGNNLFMLSNFSYYDPEIGGGWDFPVMRSFNFGVDVTF